jgi:hypothetical protein
MNTVLAVHLSPHYLVNFLGRCCAVCRQHLDFEAIRVRPWWFDGCIVCTSYILTQNGPRGTAENSAYNSDHYTYTIAVAIFRVQVVQIKGAALLFSIDLAFTYFTLANL